MNTLETAIDTSPASPFVARARPMAQGHSAGQQGGCLLYGEQTSGASSLSVADLAPGSRAPLHLHSREDETFYVLEGEIEATVGERIEILGAGDTIFLPRGVPHRLRNSGKLPARVLMLIHPPGLEKFFDEIDSSGPADPERMKSIALAYGVTILD